MNSNCFSIKNVYRKVTKSNVNIQNDTYLNLTAFNRKKEVLLNCNIVYYMHRYDHLPQNNRLVLAIYINVECRCVNVSIYFTKFANIHRVSLADLYVRDVN